MSRININHQIIYYHENNAKGIGMNLLSFGARQFLTTEIYKYRTDLVEMFPPSSKTFNLIAHLALNALTDAIKITICFENYFKTVLLLNGFCVHKLNKESFPNLYKEQFKRPIEMSEILALKTWKDNIEIGDVNLRKQIPGISKLTVGMRELLSIEYQKVIQLDEQLVELCKHFNDYRNNLHLYAEENLNSKIINTQTVSSILKFYNSNIVKLQNSLVDNLGKEERYRLKYL